MLFLFRPRQTWMPYALPRDPSQQQAYNRQLQQSYSSTRRVAPPVIGEPAAPVDTVSSLRDLAALRDSGALTDDEFAAAKARLLEQPQQPGR